MSALIFCLAPLFQSCCGWLKWCFRCGLLMVPVLWLAIVGFLSGCAFASVASFFVSGSVFCYCSVLVSSASEVVCPGSSVFVVSWLVCLQWWGRSRGFRWEIFPPEVIVDKPGVLSPLTRICPVLDYVTLDCNSLLRLMNDRAPTLFSKKRLLVHCKLDFTPYYHASTAPFSNFIIKLLNDLS
jgi:hypothetical protein